ncbi:MAG: hypothetical protein JNK20_16700 [Flavipsychrobacter sp.]|jgi:hypothetical protein|nr:hypothetical protein [Flavipsychrobacter sp.]
MNLEYKHLLPADFDAASRVWIYQSNRIFSMMEALEVEKVLTAFTDQWQAHGAPVKGFATLFFGQFIVLMADETQTGVSGCSTDSSVRMIKAIEEGFGVTLFDRQLLAFVVKEKIQLIPMAQLAPAVQGGFVSGDTLYFNNTVATKAELENNWIIPVKDSWLKTKLALQSA